jgi:hypothetical protein
MTLGVYTTVYPGVEEYLRDWSSSLAAQVDRDFDLWVGVDGFEVESINRLIAYDGPAVWISAGPGDTPASLRDKAFGRMVEACDAVVLVDSDDILHPTRVESARRMLQRYDLVGCGLRLVDEHKRSLGAELALAPGADADSAFPRTNVFGLSNSAFRSELLRKCLPIPPGVELVDWYLATRAWLAGSRLGFGREAEMDYRQHPGNMVRVLPPFEEARVAHDTERVREHLRFVLEQDMAGARGDRLDALRVFGLELEVFHQRVVLDQPVLTHYVSELDRAPAPLPWWSWVANPGLRHLWTSTEDMS